MKHYSLLFLVILPFSLFAQTLAFPEAEGFGKYATGGRGGKVVTVTSLKDYTSKDTPIEGTLRWALEQFKHTQTIDGKTITVFEPLTIVFNVAGNIELLEDLKVKRSNLTIAGQSAPGDGICITGHSMTFNGATGGEMWYFGPRRKNVIIRYLRFRPTIPTDQSYVTYGTDIENYEDIILDHCTMTWANEECLAIYDTKNTTVQYCLIAEGLYNANHKKGNRSYCGVWGGQFASYHHNLVAHCDSRNIRFNGARAHDTIAVVDYHNNIVYNWGTNNSGYGLEVEILTPQTRNELNMVNNYYKHGPATGYNGQTTSKNNKLNRLVRIDQNQTTIDEGYLSKHYIIGNYLSNYPDVTQDNWFCGVQFNSISDTAYAKSVFRSDSFSPEIAQLNSKIESAEDAFIHTLMQVGACSPKRDWQDGRIISETRQGTAIGKGSKGKDGIIDDPQVVGGWPELKGTPYTDSDADGIPDEEELLLGLNPKDSTDGSLITENGYSNLELYLNNIPQDTTFVAPEQPQDAINNILYSEQDIRNIEVYDMTGRLVQTFKNEKSITCKGPFILKINLNNQKYITKKCFF